MGKNKKGKRGNRSGGDESGDGSPSGSQEAPPQVQQEAGRGRGRGAPPFGRGQGQVSGQTPGAAPQQQREPALPSQQEGGRGRGRGVPAFGHGRGQVSEQTTGTAHGQQGGLSHKQQGGIGRGQPGMQSQRPSGADTLQESFPSLSVSSSAPQQIVQQAPVREVPTQRAPPQQMPGQQVPTQRAPPQQMSGQQAPTQRAPPQQLQATVPAPPPEFTLRKTQGTKGRPILVETNHMALTIKNTNTYIHYDVDINPDKPKRLLRPAVMEFLKQACPGRNPAFDGKKNLYSVGLLPFKDPHSLKVRVNNVERNCIDEYEVTMKKVKSIDSSGIQQYLASNKKSLIPQDCLHVIDVVMRNTAANRMTQVGRSFFSAPVGRVEYLGNGMELWIGHFQSTSLGWKPFINLDVAHKGFPTGQQVIDLICELANTNRNELQGLNQYQHMDVERFLKGLKVEYEVPGQPNTKRVYRVNGLKDPPSKLTFESNDTGKKTVEQYFLESRNYRMKFPLMPCLHVGARDRQIYLPAELCRIVAGQATIKKLDEVQTRSMIKAAATPANIRKDKIMGALRNLALNRDPCMQEFGITVSEQMEKVQARVLNPPALEYSQNAKVQPQKGEWRLNNREQFLKGGTLRKWAILNLDRIHDSELRNFQELLVKNGKNFGMDVDQCSGTYNVNMRNTRELITQLEKLKGYHIVFIVVPDRGDAYSKVKQVSELQMGVLTQCIKATTIKRRMNPATACNILLKVNAKLNGINHALHTSTRPSCLLKPVMIMGADVTHPPPDSQSQPSVAAVTASHDPKAFMYNTMWRLQPPRMEIIEDLQRIVVAQLQFFYKKTGHQPQRIIFYRDGVSDGQFAEVMQKEMTAIRRACATLNKDYNPPITFLVVQKRHHTRFFPTNRADEDGRNRNVPPGLVVDRTITHPRDMDFYLVSHASIQGTSRPTKYHMLHDDANMTEDDVEELTYYLCHLFSRCNRSVSYPAPTYYAHLAAFRAKTYIEGSRIDIDNLPKEQNMRIIKENIVQGSPMFFV